MEGMSDSTQALVWMLLGLVLVISEAFLPGMTAGFLGVAALLTAGLVWVGLTGSFTAALLAWMGLSVGLVVGLRRVVLRMFPPATTTFDPPRPGAEAFGTVVEVVEDVDQDPVVIVDGLTKNWRYPGWRVCWTVGPREIIEGVASAGSFLDGGCARPMQLAARPLVERALADQEARALQACFRVKRRRMIEGLEALGIRVDPPPQGGFYCWGDLRRLPEGLRDSMAFFRRALEEKVIVVPGAFFDVNPGQRRPDRPSRYRHHVRFSFGPELELLERGLAGLARVVGG